MRLGGGEWKRERSPQPQPDTRIPGKRKLERGASPEGGCRRSEETRRATWTWSGCPLCRCLPAFSSLNLGGHQTRQMMRTFGKVVKMQVTRPQLQLTENQTLPGWVPGDCTFQKHLIIVCITGELKLWSR